MKTSDCIQAAQRALARVRRYFECGDFSRGVDDLTTALLWAMEAWLMASGFEISHGRGWADTYFAFREKCPPEMCRKIMSCDAEASYLKYSLQGDLDEAGTVPPMDEWIPRAQACLENAKKVVHQLLVDIDPQTPIDWWLDRGHTG